MIATAYLPHEKFQSVLKLYSSLKTDPRTTMRSCLRLLTHMASCTDEMQDARLYLMGTQSWLKTLHKPNRHPLNMLVHLGVILRLADKFKQVLQKGTLPLLLMKILVYGRYYFGMRRSSRWDPNTSTMVCLIVFPLHQCPGIESYTPGMQSFSDLHKGTVHTSND